LLFKSYLGKFSQFDEVTHMERRNFTQYKYTSSLIKIVYDVPQGSILGTFLFLLYTNYLSLNIQGLILVLL